MHLARIMFVLLLALLWAPMTVHCQIEAMTDLPFLSCESEAGPCSDRSSQGAGTPCCAWESGEYQPPSHSPLVAPVILALISPQLLPDVTAPLEGALGGLIDPPPELPPAWQFIHRAAPMARAPSLTS